MKLISTLSNAEAQGLAKLSPEEIFHDLRDTKIPASEKMNFDLSLALSPSALPILSIVEVELGRIPDGLAQATQLVVNLHAANGDLEWLMDMVIEAIDAKAEEKANG